MDLEAELKLSADEEEEILPPTSEEKGEHDEDEKDLLDDEEEEVSKPDHYDEDEELEMEDDEEEKYHSERKDLGKLKDILMSAVKYLEEDTEKAVVDEAKEVGKALATLKKNGINVYSGQKATPAPKRVIAKKPEPTNWLNFSKSLDEINMEEERSNGGQFVWQG